MKTKTTYIATAPNGSSVKVTSTRQVKNCHLAIDRETGEIGVARWTASDNKLANASASSCGFSLGYYKGYHSDRKQQAEWNAAADAYKSELDAKYTYIIVSAVAA
jgi:hypothetical protein